MLNQVLEKVVGTHYPKWKKHADNILAEINRGLGKVKDPTPTNQQLAKIREALKAINDGNLAKEEYIKQLGIISENLNILANTTISPSEINHFIFQARRSVNALIANNATAGYIGVVDRLVAPSRNVQENSEPGFLAGKGIDFAAKQINNNLTSGFENEYLPFLRMQIDNLPEEVKVEKISPNANKTLIQQKLGEWEEGIEKSIALKRKRPIRNKADVAKSLAEQIYGTAFESTYSQVVAGFDVLQKIDRLASQESSIEETSALREKLLKESGFSELATKEGLEYLDNLAKHLGFDNAKHLYQNYQNLDKEDKVSFNYLKDAKYKFMDFALTPSPGNDPLEKVKAETEKEYARIKEKMKSSDFRKKNTGYASTVGIFTNDIIRALDNAKRTQIIVENVPENAVANWGAYLGNQIVGWIGWFQDQPTASLDDYIFSGLYKENALLEQRIQDYSLPLDSKIVQYNQKAAQENIERRKNLLGRTKEGYNETKDIELVQNYAARMQMLMVSEEQLKKIDKTKQPNEYLSKQGVVNELEKEYKNYSDAFNAQFDRDIREMPQQALEDLIQRKQTKLSEIEKRRRDITFQINARKATIDAFEKKERSVRGMFTRWRDNVFGVFGYKTKSAKTRETLPKEKIQLESLESELVRLNFEETAEKGILEKANAQSELLGKHEHDPNVNNLVKNTLDLIDQTFALYRAMGTSHTTSEDFFKIQQQFLQVENEMKIAVTALTSRLNKDLNEQSLTPEEVAALHVAVAQAKTAYENLSPALLDLPQDTASPLIATLDGLEKAVEPLSKRNEAQKREEQIKEAKRSVANLFHGKSVKDIKDPFSLIHENKNTIFKNFSGNDAISRTMQDEIWKHAKEVYSQLLKEASPTLTKEELEKIYLNFKTAFLSTKNEWFKSAYVELSRIIIPELKIKESKTLNSLDEDLSRITKLTHEAITNRETAQSWLWNPFGTTSVENAKSYETASIDYLLVFLNNYKTVVPNFYHGASHSELAKHLDNLKICNKLLEEMAKKSPQNHQIREIQTKLREQMEFVNKIDLGHVSHKMEELPGLFSSIGNDTEETKELHKQVEETITEIHQFDDKKYAQYNEQLVQISNNIAQLKSQIDAIDKQFANIGVNKENPNQDFQNWESQKIQYHENLKSAENAINELKDQKLPILKFYSEISRGMTPTITLPPLDRATINQGLLVAIQYKNAPALQHILKEKSVDGNVLAQGLKMAAIQQNTDALQRVLTVRKFDIKDIETALEIAAMQGNFTNMEMIFTHREDAVLRQEIIDKCIKNAFMNIPAENADPNEPHRQVIHYLIMHSNMAPQTFREIVDGMNTKGTIELAIVNKHIIDNDYENLTKIRHYFIFESELLVSLNKEFESLNKSASQLKDNKDPRYQQIMKDIDAFQGKLNKIAEMRKTYLDMFYIENKDKRRDEEYIKGKWEKEMPHTIAGYREVLDAHATRIFKASMPKVEKAQKNVVTTKEAVVVELPQQVEKTTITKMVEPNVEKLTPEQHVTKPSQTNEVVAPTITPPEKGKEEVEVVTPPTIEEPNGSENKIVIPPTEYNFKQTQSKLTDLLSSYSMSTDRIIEIKKLLKEYRKNIQNEEQQNEYSVFVSKAINDIAKKDKETPDALLALISAIKDPRRKEENIRNAFFVAISNGQYETVQSLCSKNLHREIKSDLFDHLYNTLQTNKNRIADTSKDYFGVALSLLTSDLVDPTSLENEEKMKEILDLMSLYRSYKAEPYTAISGSWGGVLGEDHDKPLLENMRNLYIYCDNVFSKISHEVDLLNTELERSSDKSIDKLTPEQIKNYEAKIASWEREWKAISEFKTSYTQLLTSKIQNKEPRLKGYLTGTKGWTGTTKGWDQQFNEQYLPNEEKFKESIKGIENVVSEYHKQENVRVKPVTSSLQLSMKEATLKNRSSRILSKQLGPTKPRRSN
ncbi:MAG: hypothetical protein BGO43_09995 [Gammaproteobacteria bacterium 39-13]|nr:hypothetical protein [Gammaproteobacteria bacterium]OJV89089.1 MAG: hypothetical protein BGO43_09995 [Gammaproteobacteria bacterium 39-13]